MPRHLRVHAPNLFYHIIARGNNQQKIYVEKADYEKFLNLLCETKKRYPFSLYGYILMPDHFHLLLEVKEDPTSRIMQSLLSGYSKYFKEIIKDKSKVKEVVRARKEFIRRSVIENIHQQSKAAKYLNCDRSHITRIIRS